MFGRKKSTPAPAVPSARRQPSGNKVTIVQDEENPIAYDLNKIKDPVLVEEAKAVAVNLKKNDLQGIRARVILLVDISTSMRGDFHSGAVQALIRRCLAFGLNVDTDGTIEVIPFGYRAGYTRDVDANGIEPTVRELALNLEPSTNLTDALLKVLAIAQDSDEVIYVFVVTDGNPNDARSAAEAYAALASHAVFVKNVAIRDVEFLRQVDEYDPATASYQLQPLAGRKIDNCNTQFIADPSAETADTFARRSVVEWHSWFIAAQHAGILV